MKPITAHPFWVSVLILVIAVVLSIAVGSVFISPGVVLSVLGAALTGSPLPPEIPDSFRSILIDLRLPRTVLMMLSGAALSVSGASYQGLFRNPLADPYLIGVASGAGLGAVIAMSLQASGAWGWLIIPLAAFAAALLTVTAVFFLARVGRTLPATNLILAGVAVSSFATALTSFIMISSTGEIRRAVIWLLGGSSLSGWQPVTAALPYIALGAGALLLMGHVLNVLQFGDEQAQQLGISVERMRLIIVAAASLATAAAVAFTGIIGFVGLVVPHLCRLVWGGDYRRLLPLSLVCGASFLLFADILARVLLSPQELPVGIITALAGAPFFLWVLRRARHSNLW